MGTGEEPGAADRGRASRAAARDPAVHRDCSTTQASPGSSARPAGAAAAWVRIDKPLDGVRVCRTCIAHSRAEPCARCGAIRDPVTRDGQGQPVCANCFVTAPENLETCTGCGRVRPVERRTADGPLCSRCPSLPVLACSACGRRCPAGSPGQPGCHGARPASGTGPRARHAAATRRLPPAPWTASLRRLHPAATVGWLPRLQRPGSSQPRPCARCLVNARLDELMGPADGPLPPGLRALRREIATAEHTVTAIRWAAKPSIAPVLAGLADGSIPLTHQALDGLPQRRPSPTCARPSSLPARCRPVTRR